LPDGSEFVFGSGTGSTFGLWRIAMSNAAIPKRINLDASDAFAPAISRLGNRLAFATRKFDLNIWRVDVKGGGPKTRRALSIHCLHADSKLSGLFARRSEDRLYVATIRDGGNLDLRQ
jgi:hypothetical protein